MKYNLILLSFFFFFSITAQSQINSKSFSGKAIYCFKTVDKNKAEGAKSSFEGPGSYPYLLKISLAKEGVYSIINNNREHVETGKYKITSSSITLTNGSGSKVVYEIIFHADKYLTLKSGRIVYYCLVD